MPDYTYCDDDAYPAERTKASSLTPNQFHKLCPGAHIQPFSSGSSSSNNNDDGSSSSSNTKYSAFGQPRCGDGSNFSFFLSRPLKQYTNTKKILIEFMGGGACWDEDTCGMQQDMLAFPDYFDNFLGLSCSEIEYGAAVQGGNPLSLLCSKEVGGTDFRQYNTIIVPYCTQDVHIGDAPNASYDGENVIQHVGAHNMIRTLNWVFKNFPDPTHFFLTGCSAGGTAIPIAYDLINKHYNKFGPKAVHINSIMDSSVYLTPEYFLQNGFPNWNPGTIMKKRLGFNYNKYRYYQNYPDLVWHHVLKRGPNSDRWGFVSHTNDDISLMFYQYMSGNGDGGNRDRSLALASEAHHDHHRQLDNDLQSQWWSEISSSMDYASKRHNNVDTYFIDGYGHCSFGLYYPLQDEGFEEWARPILKERMVIGNRRPSVAAFLVSMAFGGVLVYLTRRMQNKRDKNSLIDSDNADPREEVGEAATTAAARMHLGYLTDKVVSKCQTWPWTAGYLLSTTIYFISMLISQGFTHPLDNPALGPSAVALSTFGINNPSLVIYAMEHFRLISSSFLCSGVTTYLFMAYTMYKTSVEAAMVSHPHWHFPLVASILSFGINLFYACIGNGASCSTLALALGLNSFSMTMSRRSSGSYPSPTCFTISVFILACTPIFPFDSLVALTAAVVIGMVLGMALFKGETASTSEIDNDYIEKEVEKNEPSSQQVNWKLVQGLGALYGLLYLLLLFRVPSPSKQHVSPYLTGCNVVYSDQIEDIVSAYTNGDRKLQDGEGDIMCAEYCVPHLVYRPALWGAKTFSPIPIQAGTCEENGYAEHIADHTIQQYTVTVEVLLYTASSDDN